MRVAPEPLDAPGKAPLAETSLRQRAMAALSVSMAAYVLSQGMRLAVNLILARLFAPDVFGLLAIATVVHVIVSLLSDIGIRQAVIHSARGDQPVLLHTAWTIQVIRGFGVWIACCVAALLMALCARLGLFAHDSVYAASQLPWVVAGISVTSVISGFNPSKSFLANRALAVNRMVLVDISAQVLSALVTLFLAWQMRSIWAFVVGALCSSLIGLALQTAWLPGGRDRFLLDRGALREVLGYGRWVMFSSVTFVLANNGDRLLLGLWVDAKVLGLYSIALSLATLADAAASKVFSDIAMPALSEVARTGDRIRFRQIYLKMRRPVDAAYLIMSGLFCALGPSIIDLLYHGGYSGAGPILQILALSLVLSRFGIANSAYLAIGKPSYQSWINFTRLLSLLAVLPATYALWGLNGALVGVVLFSLPSLVLVFAFNERLGLNDWGYECRALMSWPLGFAMGWVVKSVF